MLAATCRNSEIPCIFEGYEIYHLVSRLRRPTLVVRGGKSTFCFLLTNLPDSALLGIKLAYLFIYRGMHVNTNMLHNFYA